MRRKLLIVLISLIFFSSLSSAQAETCTDFSEYGSLYTLEVEVEEIPAIEKIIYNVTVELRINEFKPSVSSLNNIRLYAKIKGETYHLTKYKQVDEEIHNTLSSPKSVNASFSYDLTNITEEVTVYGGSSFNEFLTEGLEVGTCTYWLNAQTLSLETTMETNYIGYLTIIIAFSILIIVKRQKKKKILS
ncbi:MAG: hypothetical protein ACW96U_08195 [Candidatus Heimdallarchaeaceae archaeon]|jgi:hypothetical protein